MNSTQHKPHQIKSKQNAPTQSKHNRTQQIKTKHIKNTSNHVKQTRFKTQQRNTHQIESKRSNQIE